jgi:hypothetical protein
MYTYIGRPKDGVKFNCRCNKHGRPVGWEDNPGISTVPGILGKNQIWWKEYIKY